MSFFPRVFLKWLPLGVAVTLVCGLVYVTVQQNYRQSLNDPQIQMAEDAAAELSSGKEIDEVVPTNIVDMTSSLSPWLAVYTNTGVPLLSSGKLNGELPQLPPGVFSTSTWKGYAEDRFSMQVPPDETRFTWQPASNVRQAVVLVHFDSANGIGFVAAGRNMREVENREGVLVLMSGIGWVVTMVATFATQALAEYLL